MKIRQSGFTLIELMIAMAIGLVLTLAALHVFLTNQRNFALQQTLAELNEDGQMGIRYIANEIRQAGLGDAVSGSIPAVDTDNSSNGSGSGNDSLAIEYWGYTPCAADIGVNEEGGELPRHFRTVYSVSDNTLQCTSTDVNTGTDSTVSLLSGVQGFQVLYGIDGNDDGELAVNQYVTADAIDDNPVVAIRFGLLLRRDNVGQLATNEQIDYYILGQKYECPGTSLCRAYSTTVRVRNYDWERIHIEPDSLPANP